MVFSTLKEDKHFMAGTSSNLCLSSLTVYLILKIVYTIRQKFEQSALFFLSRRFTTPKMVNKETLSIMLGIKKIKQVTGNQLDKRVYL